MVISFARPATQRGKTEFVWVAGGETVLVARLSSLLQGGASQDSCALGKRIRYSEPTPTAKRNGFLPTRCCHTATGRLFR